MIVPFSLNNTVIINSSLPNSSALPNVDGISSVDIFKHEELWNNISQNGVNDFSIPHTNWIADSMIVRTSQWRDNVDITEIIHDLSGEEDYARLISKDLKNGNCSSEIATNFSISHAITLKSIIFAIDLSAQLTYAKINHVRNTTVEIRSDVSGYPHKTSTLASINLGNCIIVDFNATENGKTIYQSLMDNYDDYINALTSRVIVRADFSVSLPIGIYWIVFNSTKVLTDSDLHYIHLYTYDDGIKHTELFNRDYNVLPNGNWVSDKTNITGLDSQNDDIYLKITYRITDDVLPSERNLRINGQIIPDTGVYTFLSDITSFSVTPDNITMNVVVEGRYHRDQLQTLDFFYHISGSTVTWTKRVYMTDGIGGTEYGKNMSLTYPSHWSPNNAFTTSSTFDITATSSNCISGMLLNSTKILSGNSFIANASGILGGNYLNYTIWKSGESTPRVTVGNRALNENVTISTIGLPIGIYTLCAKYVNASQVGYITQDFEVYGLASAVFHFQDQDGIALQGITVEISNTTWASGPSVTNSIGNYTCQNLEHGVYNITWSYNATLGGRVEFTVSGNYYNTIVVTIWKEPIEPPDDDDGLPKNLIYFIAAIGIGTPILGIIYYMLKKKDKNYLL